MKTIVLILISILACLNLLAQQRISGQWALQVHGGIAAYNPLGYYGSIGVEKIFGSTRSSLHITPMYRVRQHPSDLDQGIRVSHYDLHVQYGCQLLKGQQLPFYLLLKGGFFGSYEQIPSTIFEHVYMVDQSGMRYGFSFAPEVEFIATRKINFSLQALCLYTIGSGIENFTFLPGIGMKVYF